jgi:uncharacterized protein YhdP
VIDLEHLELNFKDGQEDEAVSTMSSPESWPPLEIHCKEFVYNGFEYGELTLSGKRHERGVRFEQIGLKSELLQVLANGSWLGTASGQQSDFNFKLTTPDLGRLLKALDYSAAIDGGSTSATLHAQWNGSPDRFDINRVEGELSLAIVDGRLLDIEPSGGRVFGLLSVQALPRRLALDFSDIYKKGLGFDRIEGSFSITEGNAYTNDLFVEGPSSKIDMSGRIGLMARDYDQDIYVTPNISSSLPVVGGLAGGPAVGLGLLLAERLFKGKLDRLSRIHYEMKGPWDNPEMTRLDGEE